MSRGVTARIPGDTYTNTTNSSDVLAIKEIRTFPNLPDTESFDSVTTLVAELHNLFPSSANVIHDNSPTNTTKAAIIIDVTDTSGNVQHWVRFVRKIPQAGMHGLWSTLRGYRYSKAAANETIPIKPSDLITDENYRSTDELTNDLISGIESQLIGTSDAPLIDIIIDAVVNARVGSTAPIANAAKYSSILAKYAGEYLGPLALIDGGFHDGDTKHMLAALGVDSLKGSTVMFPQSTQFELFDSIIRLPDGRKINISSKIHNGGGAASSLSGVIKRLTPAIEAAYPAGTELMKILGTETAVDGLLTVAAKLGIITNKEKAIVQNFDKSSRNTNGLATANLRELFDTQCVRSTDHINYRTFYHVMCSIANRMNKKINAMPEFRMAMRDTLNSVQYVQLVTSDEITGENAAFNYYTKLPSVFNGELQLFNKSYLTTGIKGRMGFKLKTIRR